MNNTNTNTLGANTIYQFRPTDTSIITELLMESAFFLPRDILYAPDWKVHNIVVLSNKDFADFAQMYLADSPAVSTHFETSYQLTCFAKHIGISARKHLATGRYYLVIKPWYGSNPHTKNEGGIRESTPEQLGEFINFLFPSSN